MDAPPPETAITSDNIHLSEVIQARSQIASDDVCTRSSIHGCSDPKILEFIAAATAENTRRAYQSDVRHFIEWGGSIPAEPTSVARYLAAHADKLSMATLGRRIVAIRRAHTLRGVPDPTKAELVRLTIRGVRRLNGRPQRRVAPLRIEHLSAITSVLGQSIRDVRDRALLLVGFAGAFRRSELVAVSCEQIKREEQGIVITLPRSKTDQEGRGRSVAIPRIESPVCPVAALETWLQACGIVNGPLFRPISKAGKVLGSQLSAGAVSIIVKQRAAQIGLDPQRYSGHSLRAGFATSAAAAGLAAWQIKSQTGHVSDAVIGGYIRETDPLEGIAAVFSGLAGRSSSS